ncbi:L-rhamnose-binding lectin CSL3-like isoform X2 [Perca fluviatilis]|uniref:L-rhamnose-binding lectin CSL3-like isoform X2 n=1 Tax=Perca fluviatilis TaxID=8168 RepID=UPI001962819D|nr:L-rhamnose-binding lectin CSL3-like isoform X2 [Perca fluviatilis]
MLRLGLDPGPSAILISLERLHGLEFLSVLAATWCWISDGQLYDVACPGVNSQLQCPEEHVIEVLSVQHGAKSSADCTARSQPAVVSDEKCIHKDMIGWIKFICDKLEQCRLPKPNRQMFVCDYSEDTFVQITYNCNKKSADVRTTVVCEDQAGVLECETGVLNIVRANFGRLDMNTCTDTPSDMTFCASPTAAGRLKTLCEGKQSCDGNATSANLGEPAQCDDLPKYLTVDYVCQ